MELLFLIYWCFQQKKYFQEMATGRTTKFCLKVEEVQGMLGNLSFAKNFSHNWDIRFQSEIWIKKLVVSYAANLAPQLLKQH